MVYIKIWRYTAHTGISGLLVPIGSCLSYLQPRKQWSVLIILGPTEHAQMIQPHYPVMCITVHMGQLGRRAGGGGVE